MSKAPAPAAEEGAAPKKKGKLPLLIIIGVLVLALIGGGAAFMLMGGKKKTKKGAKAKEVAEHSDEEGHGDEETDETLSDGPKKPPTFSPFDAFTVNLADEGRERYLQMVITFEVSDPQAEAQLKAFTTVIRSNVLIMLTTKTATELLTQKGKQAVQDEILEIARKPFINTKVYKQIRKVHFTSFVIQ